MTTVKIYQVDAFTNELFRGNPAAVCPLNHWLPEEKMQQIAAENNLSETAFFVPEKEVFHIRWFTPLIEVELCGHATLASAHVLFHHEGYEKEEIIFYCKVGILKVRKKNAALLSLDFPSSEITEVVPSIYLSKSLGKTPIAYFTSGVFGMAVFKNENDILTISPDFDAMTNVEEKVIIITSVGEHVDFVSRVFGPKVGINEDPVTGSAHTRLIPFWAEKLKKQKLNAIQLSERKGYLECENLGSRVLISGEAVTYMIGNIYI